MKNNIREEILNKIEKGEIKKKIKLQFVLRQYFVWLLAAMSIIIGSISTSIIIFSLVNSREIGGFLQAIPLIWVIVLIIFLATTYYNVRHTRKGYRYNFWIIFILSILISIVVGIGIFVFKGSSHIDQKIDNSFPSYKGVSGKMQDLWVSPDKGLLAGEVLVLRGDVLSIRDFGDNEWSIDIENISNFEKNLIKDLDEVRVVGKRVGDRTFEACTVTPWVAPRGKYIEKKKDLEKMFLEIGGRPRLGREDGRLLNDLLLGERNIEEMRTKLCGE